MNTNVMLSTYRSTVSSMDDTTAIAIILAMMGTFAVIAIIWYVLQIIAYWKIFSKAGEAGWKSIIPFYNTYTQYKLTWNTKMFWLMIALSVVSSGFLMIQSTIAVIGSILMIVSGILGLISLNKLSKAFGHGIGFTLGLIFFNPIFMLILGFGSSEYIGPQ